MVLFSRRKTTKKHGVKNMNIKKKLIVGIDVSKDTFNAHCGGKDVKHPNNAKGWKNLVKDFPAATTYAMEATGNYSYRISCFLKSQGFAVFILNPLRVKNHRLSNGIRAKSDSIDPLQIAEYAFQKQGILKPFEPLHPKMERAKRIVTLLRRLSKMERAAGNVKHAFSLVAKAGDRLLVPMDNVSELVIEEQKCLKKELYEIISEFYPKEFKLIQSVKGVSKKTAAVFLVQCNGLADFINHKQLSSWIGIAPGTEESGTSVKGSGKIKKAGCSYLRKMLYGCVASAVRYNHVCRDMYIKLRSKGRTHKKAAVAVMHKLVKIIFGIIKSGEPCRNIVPV